MITVQKILFLRKVPLFAGMSTRELGRVAGIAEEVVVPKGEIVLKEGEFGDSMFVIVDGSVVIHRADVNLNSLKPGDYLGEMSILDGEPRSASATATSDTLLLRINQSEFHEILSSSFEAVRAIFRTLSLRLRKKEADAQQARLEAAAALAEATAGRGGGTPTA